MARSSTSAAPGNQLATTHGAHSQAIVTRRAEAILAEWRDPENGLPLAHPVDAVAVEAAARSAAIFNQLAEFIEANGPLDRRGHPRPATRLFFRGLDSLMAALRQLGATPSSRAEMAGGMAAARRSATAAHAQRTLQEKYGGGAR